MSTQQEVRTAYRRLVKAGGRIRADGELIGLENLLTAGCLDDDGLASLARNMADLASVAEALEIPGEYRPEDIPEGAHPVLDITCGTDGAQRFDWSWSTSNEHPSGSS